jgi:hypothetical protein
MTIAFDVDGTLIDEKDMPRLDIIGILRSLLPYCEIVVWSGSGAAYAQIWGRRLFLPEGITYASKMDCYPQPDICFDDMNVALATVNVRV